MKKHVDTEEQKGNAADAKGSGVNDGEQSEESSGKVNSSVSSPEGETAGPEAPGNAESSEPSPEEAATARIAELERLNRDLQDQYLRKAADFDNYRKRMIREKQEAIDFANSNLLVDLVQVLDDFDRAIGHAGDHEAGSSAAALAEGVSMIRGQLGSMLESKYGLTYYPAKGEPFDPNVHEAIGTQPSEDVSEATVAEEFLKGYKLKDRIIRPAKVMVWMPAQENK